MRSTSLVALLAIMLALGLAHPAGASPLSDALARHGTADVAALRSHRDDIAARCTLGAVYARRNDLPRAALYLAGCDDAALPDDLAAALRPIARDVKRRLAGSRLAAVAVVTRPDGLRAEIDALPGDPFTAPATVWVAAGEHEVRVVRGEQTFCGRVATEPGKNAVLVIDTMRGKPAPRSRKVDFVEEEPALGEHITAPPPDVKHPSLLGNRYRGIPDAPSGPPIEDPPARMPRRPAPRPTAR